MISVLVLLSMGLAFLGATAGTAEAVRIIRPPTRGRLYHGVYPGLYRPSETQISENSQSSYVQFVGKPTAWVLFTNDWFQNTRFPIKTASWIKRRGSVPYIRLNIRSTKSELPERKYTLARIIRGDFDARLRRWARGARDFKYPLIVDYGFEMNGRWEPWNGFWNGRAVKDAYGDPNIPDGPERFRDTYRHVVDVMRDEGARNIVWVFHVNDRNNPESDWNKIHWYYPGSDWVDWVGVSVYGPQTTTEDYDAQFKESMDIAYRRITRLAPRKPVVVTEFGVVNGNPRVSQSVWASRALTYITRKRWPRVIGFSWWNNGDPVFDDSGRVQNHPELLAVFKRLVTNNPKVLGRPIFKQR